MLKVHNYIILEDNLISYCTDITWLPNNDSLIKTKKKLKEEETTWIIYRWILETNFQQPSD